MRCSAMALHVSLISQPNCPYWKEKAHPLTMALQAANR